MKHKTYTIKAKIIFETTFIQTGISGEKTIKILDDVLHNISNENLIKNIPERPNFKYKIVKLESSSR